MRDRSLRSRSRASSFLALGQVEVRADDAHHRPLRLPPHWIAARQHLHVVTVLVPQAELDLVQLVASRHAGVQARGAREIVGMDQPFER